MPLAVPFARRLDAAVCIYDNMDELSAPQRVATAFRARTRLFARGDAV